MRTKKKKLLLYLRTPYDDKSTIRVDVVWEHKGVGICFQDEQAVIFNAT